MAPRRSRNLIRAMTAAKGLALDELRQLDEHVQLLISRAEAEQKQLSKSVSRIVVEERSSPTGTYRLELVKCGKPACKVCKGGPAHGPYWYAYWKEDGRTRTEYIGKKLKPRKGQKSLP